MEGLVVSKILKEKGEIFVTSRNSMIHKKNTRLAADACFLLQNALHCGKIMKTCSLGNKMALIRMLKDSDREAVREHFRKLDADSLRMRFFCSIKGDVLDRYVEKMDFDRDMIMGIESVADGSIIGLAEVAKTREEGHGELAFSVHKEVSGRGFGKALVKRAILAARNHGYTHLHLICMPENDRMTALAKSNGMTVMRVDGENEAHIDLEPPTAATLGDEMREELCASYARGVRVGAEVFRDGFSAVGRMGEWMAGLNPWMPQLETVEAESSPGPRP